MCFSHVIVFFPLTVFPSAGFTPWPKDSHERGKGKGKGRVKEGKRKNRKGRGKGKGKEKERKRTRKGKRKEQKRKGIGKEKGKKKERKKEKEKEKEGKRKRRGKGEEKEKKGRVSHGPFLIPKVIVFVIILLSFVNPVCVFLFSGNGCNHQKRTVATTYQAPSLCRIWHAFVGAPLWQRTMKWRNQKN